MKLWKAAAALVIAVLLTGCWDRQELNDMAIVLGVGIDTAEDGHVLVTAQVIKPVAQGQTPGGSGSELPTWSVTASGSTFFDAVTELNRISPRRLYWPHLQIIIFGEELARQGIAPVITWFEKSRESRVGTYVVVTQGRAEDILNQKIELGKISSKAMADLLANAKIRQLPARQLELRTLTSLLAMPGVDISMDVIDPEKVRGKVETFQLSGAAYFTADKLAGIITNEAVHGLAIASDTYANATITTGCPRGGDGYISFQVTDFQSSLRVRKRSGQVEGTFDIFVEGNLLDQTCPGQWAEPDTVSLAEKKIEEKVEKILKVMFERAAERGSDVYGIGRELRRTDPRAWREESGNWEKHLMDVRIVTKIDANVRRTGLVVDPTINKIDQEGGEER